MPDLNPNRPGHFVFGRRRPLRALAEVDGVLGPPTIICAATVATAVADAASPNRLTVNITAVIA